MKFLNVEIVQQIIEVSEELYPSNIASELSFIASELSLFASASAETLSHELVERIRLGIPCETEKLRQIMSRLTDNALIELTALYWLGRDGEMPREWNGYFEHARSMHGYNVVNYLISKNNLAECLDKGLNMLGLVGLSPQSDI